MAPARTTTAAARAATPQDQAAADGGGRGGAADGQQGGRGTAWWRRRLPLEASAAASSAGRRSPSSSSKASRATIQAEITVVGNLIGQATVAVSPRAAGRLESVNVRLGDRVTRGQRIAKIEDFDIQEQVKQAEAAQQVSEATIRQREADLKLAQTNAERSRSLYERQLLPKQTLDDNESRYQSAMAAVDLARAQSRAVEGPPRRAAHQPRQHDHQLARHRLRVAARGRSRGVRLAERAGRGRRGHLHRSPRGQRRREGSHRAARRQRHARRASTPSPAKCSWAASPACRPCSTRPRAPRRSRSRSPTRRARLKPGMYARVSVTTSTRKETLVVPATAVVDLGGRRGVFTPLNETAVFRALDIGTEQSGSRRSPRRARGRRHGDHHRLLGPARRRPHRAAGRRRAGAARRGGATAGGTGSRGGDAARPGRHRSGHRRRAQRRDRGAERRRRARGATGGGTEPAALTPGSRATARATRRRRAADGARATASGDTGSHGRRGAPPARRVTGIVVTGISRAGHPRGIRHEHSSSRDSAAGHDVHDQQPSSRCWA